MLELKENNNDCSYYLRQFHPDALSALVTDLEAALLDNPAAVAMTFQHHMHFLTHHVGGKSNKFRQMFTKTTKTLEGMKKIERLMDGARPAENDVHTWGSDRTKIHQMMTR